MAPAGTEPTSRSVRSTRAAQYRTGLSPAAIPGAPQAPPTPGDAVLTAGLSCAYQCIASGVAYRGFGAELEVETHVPARVMLIVVGDTDDDGDYEYTEFTNRGGMVTRFDWALDHLDPGQTYLVTATATDDNDDTSYAFGEFTTLSEQRPEHRRRRRGGDRRADQHRSHRRVAQRRRQRAHGNRPRRVRRLRVHGTRPLRRPHGAGATDVGDLTVDDLRGDTGVGRLAARRQRRQLQHVELGPARRPRRRRDPGRPVALDGGVVRSDVRYAVGWRRAPAWLRGSAVLRLQRPVEITVPHS